MRFVLLKSWLLLIVVLTPRAYSQQDVTLPDWVDQGSHVNEDGTFKVLNTEDFFLQSDASLVLRDRIQQAIEAFIDETSGTGASRFVTFEDGYIQRNLVEEETVIAKETVDPATKRKSKRYAGYAKLRFDSRFADFVRQQYEQNFKTRRLQWACLSGLLGLTWLGAVHAYLRIDQATRHFYTRRLQTITIIACLIPMLVAVYFGIVLEIF